MKHTIPGRPRQDKCKNGHDLSDKANVKCSYKGKYLQRKCLICKRAYDKLRYRDDPKRRNAVIAKARLRNAAQLPPAGEWLSLGRTTLSSYLPTDAAPTCFLALPG